MLTVVTWKWKPLPGYRSQFGPDTVNVLQRMVARHYPHPHRFVCVTDDATGIDPSVEIVPLWKDLGDLPAPHGVARGPSCYRRLKAFAADAGDLFGGRFVSLDLDTVVVGDLTPLWHRPEDFVIWGDTNPRNLYNGSMWLMTAGARRHVWDRFNPKTAPDQVRAAGRYGSDQGWLSTVLGPNEARWTTQDGVYSYRNDLAADRLKLPSNARIVFFHGHQDPWGTYCQQIPWVRRNYQ